jgi:hypothetical protein
MMHYSFVMRWFLNFTCSISYACILVGMHVCMYVSAHAYIYVRMHACVAIHTCPASQSGIQVGMHTQTDVCMRRIPVDVCAHACMCVYVCVYAMYVCM